MIPQAIHNKYELPSTKQVICFLHAALGFLTKSTLIEAIWNGHLSTFPGLTIIILNSIPEYDETQKGHMNQQHHSTHSAKIKMQMENTESEED